MKCTKNCNAHVQTLFCSLNLLLGDVLVVVAFVFFLIKVPIKETKDVCTLICS